MTTDTHFWIASMTKPITGTAILMLQDEGKVNVGDIAAKIAGRLWETALSGRHSCAISRSSPKSSAAHRGAMLCR